ncbi:hypothetical protein H5P28_18510 [Ruficoccus amylovorans]|uniref:Uncharacterized protein n=1 Tax=Ruficoccus amylovorans TaxID=1804625 RepID=A0A842HL68_9BACT|nr:hypothetical protein [Ruficoccus amylovorans]MBC2596266.1 hypothetical protein [Ruficoccus amylovorans]
MAKPFIPKKRVLSLRPEARRTAEVSIQSRETIDAFVKKTRHPFGEPRTLEQSEVEDVERTLRTLEKDLLERERAVQELEVRLSEKERGLWEAEALLEARRKVFEAQCRQLARRQESSRDAAPVSKEERAALREFQIQLEQREQSLAQSRALLKEREDYVERAENLLFDKTMEQQERETELEVLADALEARRAALEAREEGASTRRSASSGTESLDQ